MRPDAFPAAAPLAAVLVAAQLLAGCMGIDVSSVRRARVDDAPAPDAALAVGAVRFVVDGAPLRYGLMDKPAMQLFHRDDGRYLATPEVGADGRFAWSLPPGRYGVAVLHGGMGPAKQYHAMVNGAAAFVNGFVDPGVEFDLRPGRNDLGTLVVSVRSRPARALLGGRVFDALESLGVEEGDGLPGFARSPFRIVRPARPHRAGGS